MNEQARPRVSKLRPLLVGLGSVVLLTVVLFAPQLPRTEISPARGDELQKNRATTSGAIPVRVFELSATRADGATGRLRATGTLEAHRHVPLAFAVSGIVHALDRDEGDRVRAGDTLGRLDPVPFESAVEQAQARVSYLEKSLARSRLLLDEKALSPEEFDAQEAELAGAHAQLKLAQWKLERSVLRAPFPGRVLRRGVELGQVVAPTVIAFELIDLETLDLRAALPAADLQRIAFDESVAVVASDDPRHRARGRIDHPPISSDSRSGTIPLLVRVDNAAGKLLPGMVAEATFAPSAGNDASLDVEAKELRIPLSALRLDDDGQAVWRVRDGRAERVEVELGAVRGDEVVVRRGLQAGDRLIDEIPDRLRDGDAVTVMSDTEVRR